MRIPGFVLASRARGALPRFLALTDAKRAPDPYRLLARLPKDCGLVWRAYDERITRTQLRTLSRTARQSHVPLFLATSDEHRLPFPLVNRHLPEHGLNVQHTNKYGMTTAAAHSERAVVAAARAGVDAVLISPVFPTRSHPGSAFLGVIRFANLARLARAHGLAIYALGGVNDASKIRRLASTGATGIAAIDLFVSAGQA